MIGNSKTKDINKEPVERHLPSLEVAKARIQLAKLRYKVVVEKARLAGGKEKVRL
jgi:hypothetical protein